MGSTSRAITRRSRRETLRCRLPPGVPVSIAMLCPAASRQQGSGMPGSSSHFLITNFAGLSFSRSRVALPPEFPGVFMTEPAAPHPTPDREPLSIAEEIAEEVKDGLDVTSHYEALKKGDPSMPAPARGSCLHRDALPCCLQAAGKRYAWQLLSLPYHELRRSFLQPFQGGLAP